MLTLITSAIVDKSLNKFQHFRNNGFAVINLYELAPSFQALFEIVAEINGFIIKLLFLAFFRTKFQIESNHYEMKLHFQTSSFSLDIS